MVKFVPEKYRERRRCVFPLCEAQVTLFVTPAYPGQRSQARRMQGSHSMGNLNLPNTPCPLSLQEVGFTPFDRTPADTEQLIEEVLPTFRKMAEEAYRQHERDPNIPRSRLTSSSQSMRGPHRMGREPEPTSNEWALGGREDEDSGHVSPSFNQSVPSYVDGHSMTPGVQPMLMAEARAHLAAALQQAGEARGAADGAKGQLQGAIGACQEATSNLLAVGTDDSDTLRSAYTQMVQAEAAYRAIVDKLGEAEQALGGAQENFQTVINALSI